MPSYLQKCSRHGESLYLLNDVETTAKFPSLVRDVTGTIKGHQRCERTGHAAVALRVVLERVA